MSESTTGAKIVVVVLFVLIGLPPGLCSMVGMFAAMTARNQSDAALYAVPSLIGLAIFGGTLWLLITTWRSKSP